MRFYIAVKDDEVLPRTLSKCPHECLGLAIELETGRRRRRPSEILASAARLREDGMRVRPVRLISEETEDVGL